MNRIDRIDKLEKEVEELNQKVESLRSHILGIYEGKMLNIEFEEKNRRNIDIMTSSIIPPKYPCEAGSVWNPLGFQEIKNPLHRERECGESFDEMVKK